MKRLLFDAPAAQLFLDDSVPCLTVDWKPQHLPADIDAALDCIADSWRMAQRWKYPLEGILLNMQYFNQLVQGVEELVLRWGVPLTTAGCRAMAFVEPITIPGQLSVTAWTEHLQYANLNITCWVFTDEESAKAWLSEQSTIDAVLGMV